MGLVLLDCCARVAPEPFCMDLVLFDLLRQWMGVCLFQGMSVLVTWYFGARREVN